MSFKEFYSELEALNWIEEHFGERLKRLQNEIEKGNTGFAELIYGYGGNGYKLLNETLRIIDGDDKVYSNIKDNMKSPYNNDIKEIEGILCGMFEYKIPEDIIVYRYMRKRDLRKLLRSRDDKVIIERGFLSTSLLPYCNGMKSFQENYKAKCLLKIYIPKNSVGIPLLFDSKQSNLKEFEVLFPNNSRLKIIKKRINIKQGAPCVECELLR